MGSLFSNHEASINYWSHKINCVESYQQCSKALFEDAEFNLGCIEVWFHFTKHVYKRLESHQQARCHQFVLEWFTLFESRCPHYKVQFSNMRETWDAFTHSFK